MKQPRKSNVAGNVFDKYATKNPFYRLAVNNFLKALDGLVKDLKPKKILEVGCGEGFLTNHLAVLFPSAQVLGTDISPKIIKVAKAKYPKINFAVENVENLSFKNKEFDLILACEVLEHVKNPKKVLFEIARVSSKYALLSVPNELIWRILNIFRGKYLKSLGNTPGHIQHWAPSKFVQLVSESFKIKQIRSPFPWIMILAKRKRELGSPHRISCR